VVLIHQRRHGFLIGGGLAEFGWPALAFGLASWSYGKHATSFAAILAVLACATLWLVNGNGCSLSLDAWPCR
jgi:hypothetical protein